MPKPDRVIDAQFEVIDPGQNRPANWYPGRKELPGWFKSGMIILALVVFVCSRIWAADDVAKINAEPAGLAGSPAPQ